MPEKGSECRCARAGRGDKTSHQEKQESGVMRRKTTLAACRVDATAGIFLSTTCSNFTAPAEEREASYAGVRRSTCFPLWCQQGGESGDASRLGRSGAEQGCCLSINIYSCSLGLAELHHLAPQPRALGIYCSEVVDGQRARRYVCLQDDHHIVSLEDALSLASESPGG